MERYRLVVAANEILSDPVKRTAYDINGAGWHGRPEVGTPAHQWSQRSQWSGFEPSDSPYRNATWEDWEKWHQRRGAQKQESVYISNGVFLSLVIFAVAVGGLGQSSRIEDYSIILERNAEIAHNRASLALQQSKMETQVGSRDMRLQNFLKNRDPYGYGIEDPLEDKFKKMLPDPETCNSEAIHDRNSQDSQ